MASPKTLTLREPRRVRVHFFIGRRPVVTSDRAVYTRDENTGVITRSYKDHRSPKERKAARRAQREAKVSA